MDMIDKFLAGAVPIIGLLYPVFVIVVSGYILIKIFNRVNNKKNV